MDGEDEEVAHGANRIMAARARKTAPYRRIPSYYDFATHKFAKSGDTILISAGMPFGTPGATNLLRIATV